MELKTLTQEQCAAKDCNNAGIHGLTDYLGLPPRPSPDGRILFCHYHIGTFAHWYTLYQEPWMQTGPVKHLQKGEIKGDITEVALRISEVRQSILWRGILQVLIFLSYLVLSPPYEKLDMPMHGISRCWVYI